MGFKHETSSPEYPQSNGLVERTIQSVKKTLKKAFENNDDPYLALLALRTAQGQNVSSAANLFFRRHLRTIIPSVNENLNLTKST